MQRPRPQDFDVDLNYYSILNISRDATDEQVKEAYHRLSKELHPDKQQTPDQRAVAQEKFHLINKVKDVLSNATRRHAYDSYGADGVRAIDSLTKGGDDDDGDDDDTEIGGGDGGGSDSSGQCTALGLVTDEAAEVKRMVEKVLKHNQLQQMEQEWSIMPVMEMELNAVDIFALDWLRSESYQRQPLFYLPPSPEVTRITLQHHTEWALNKKDKLSLSGYCVTANGMGFGNLRIANQVSQPVLSLYN
jgi:curved DNA-binding protein CbpA